MSIEKVLEALTEKVELLTAAVQENTEAHRTLGLVAGKAGREAQAEEKPAEEKPAEEKPAAKKPAAKKPAAKKPAAKKAEPPEPTATATLLELKTAASKFASASEDNKSRLQSALDHLGSRNLSGLPDAEARGKLVTYIAYWSAGLEVDFEAVDELVGALSDDDGDDTDDDTDDDVLG